MLMPGRIYSLFHTDTSSWSRLMSAEPTSPNPSTEAYVAAPVGGCHAAKGVMGAVSCAPAGNSPSTPIGVMRYADARLAGAEVSAYRDTLTRSAIRCQAPVPLRRSTAYDPSPAGDHARPTPSVAGQDLIAVTGAGSAKANAMNVVAVIGAAAAVCACAAGSPVAVAITVAIKTAVRATTMGLVST